MFSLNITVQFLSLLNVLTVFNPVWLPPSWPWFGKENHILLSKEGKIKDWFVDHKSGTLGHTDQEAHIIMEFCKYDLNLWV